MAPHHIEGCLEGRWIVFSVFVYQQGDPEIKQIMPLQYVGAQECERQHENRP
ncbi:MAG: hypothetical protein ABFD82_05525 [Syntrophaceae bacterium]